jgi:hypothetical protein
VGLLLVVPVPFVISQFERPALTQFTIGSVYAWALVLCLAVLILDEWRLARAAGAPEGEGALGRLRGSPAAS